MGLDVDDCGLKRIERGRKVLMEMGTERSKSLHNFTLPCSLKWGSQRLLRCMKAGSNGAVDRRSSAAALDVGSSSIERFHRRAVAEGERLTDRSGKSQPAPLPEIGSLNRISKALGEEGIETIREKLMLGLQTVADKMKGAILREGLEENSESAIPVNQPEAETDAVRPWNLRTRRAACKAPTDDGPNSSKADVVPGPKSSPVRAERSKSPLLAVAAVVSSSSKKRDRAKFSVSLSKGEIEEDYFTIAGRRPLRRPKKRSKTVQKELDYLFPGLFLTEINADFYKVPDPSDNGKS